VDSTQKPDANIAITIDRISKYHAIARYIPPDSKRVIELVALENRAIGHAKEYRGLNHAKGVRLLQIGLDIMADKLGY